MEWAQESESVWVLVLVLAQESESVWVLELVLVLEIRGRELCGIGTVLGWNG